MKIRISITNEVLGKKDETFKILEVENINDITLGSCRNVVALHCVKQTYKTGNTCNIGMWKTEIL